MTMNRIFVVKIAVSLLAVVSLSTGLQASVVEYDTPAGATVNGLSVDAKATFITFNGGITVLLENLQKDPHSVAQNLSGLFFTISTGQTAGTLVSSSGLERSVDSAGHYTDGSFVSTGWMLNTVGSQLQLNVLGTPTAPEHTILGPAADSGIYANANSSIKGNGPHNPFLLGNAATFNLSVAGVTAASKISSAVFAFNTAPGYTVPGSQVPEPATLGLLAAGGLGLLMKRRNRQKIAA